MDDRYLVHLPAVGFVAADANFDAPQRHRIRRRRFALADIVDNAVAIVVETIRALIGAMCIADEFILIQAIVFIMVRPRVERRGRRVGRIRKICRQLRFRMPPRAERAQNQIVIPFQRSGIGRVPRDIEPIQIDERTDALRLIGIGRSSHEGLRESGIAWPYGNLRIIRIGSDIHRRCRVPNLYVECDHVREHHILAIARGSGIEHNIGYRIWCCSDVRAAKRNKVIGDQSVGETVRGSMTIGTELMAKSALTLVKSPKLLATGRIEPLPASS